MPKRTKVKDVFSLLQRREARLAQTAKDGGSNSLSPSDAMATVHPRSRKVVQLQRCKIRERKMNSFKLERRNNDSLLDRLEWIKVALLSDSEMAEQNYQISLDIIHQLLEKYLERFSEEEKTIKETLRVGRPTPKRLDQIAFIKKMESEEYRGAGIELPNLMSPKILQSFLVWDGLKESIKELEIKRFKKQQK